METEVQEPVKQCVYYTCAISGETKPIWLTEEGANALRGDIGTLFDKEDEPKLKKAKAA